MDGSKLSIVFFLFFVIKVLNLVVKSCAKVYHSHPQDRFGILHGVDDTHNYFGLLAPKANCGILMHDPSS